MENQNKNLWLKIILRVLLLVVFLLPVSFHLNDKENLVTVNRSFALITSLDISPISQSNIKIGDPGSVEIQVQVTGQPDPNEQVWYQIIRQGFGGSKKEGPLAIDNTASSKTYTYTIPFTIQENNGYLVSVYSKLVPDKSDYKMIESNGVAFAGDGSSINNNAAYGLSALPRKPEFDIGCGYHPSTWFTKCPVLFLYNFIFQPLSSLTTLAAKFLDFFVYYSISSDAYRSGFVEKAWSVVRDISNMLFIIALLYVAIKTILGMNLSANKKIVGYIVLIALIINFSLFVSRVIIDASNILARVFYNNITPYDEHGNPIPPESNQPKSVSVGLVRTFEPQKVISDPKEHTGEFALVTIIFIILLVYMILMFISIAMLFVGRVAGLWMAMMFSPLAFTSLALPFSIPKFNFSKWKTDIFKLAFMAPIFAFFLYIIILFGGFLGQIQYDSGNTADSLTGWLDALMKNVIPFILIFVLLKEAKSIVKEYAGEMGAAINGFMASAGGLALGAVTGGAAIAGRRVLGRAGAYVARNASKDNAVGRAVGRIGKRMSTASWDARNVKIMGKGLSDTGLKRLNTITPPKTGGYQKFREDLKQKRLKRAEEISKVEYGEKESKDLRKVELDLHTLMDENKTKLESLDKKIEGARQNLQDAKAADDGSAAAKDKIARYSEQIGAFKAHKNAIRKGERIDIQYLDYDANNNVVIERINENYTSLKANGKSIQELESDVIPKAKKAIRDKEKKRKLAYADRLSKVFWSDGHQEVAHKIRSGAAFDSK